jgi:hypothetical protein
LTLFALVGSGCYAETRTGAVVRATYTPAHVHTYPHVVYDGRVVYLIDDHWYYHDGAHWVYYTREPEVLVRRRATIRQSPAVIRHRPGVHQAPPARPHRPHRADPPPRRRGHDHREPNRHY